MDNKDIRIQEFFEKSETEIIQFLLKYWEIEPQDNNTIRLIGTYEKNEKLDKNDKEFGFFTNVRNLNGDILYYPFRLGQVRIFSMHKEQYTTDYFQIDVDLAKEQVRKNTKNPFVLNLNKAIGKTSNKIMDRLENERFIKTIFNETGFTQRDAKGLSNALKRIAGDLYTETERFIFELLQNADDLPNENNEVEVKFKLLKENLLFLHTGKQFTKEDVESISSIGDSTKRKDSEKTGYKGIGFKSVFSDANTVLINSGNFSFSFDRDSPLYKEVNIDETPWEIKPIWTERYRYPKEVRNCEDFFNYPVAIDLEVDEIKIENYKKQINTLFEEPRFLLFLRNVKNISVDGLNKVIDIKKVGENNSYIILNNDIILSEWIIDDFEFIISEEVKDLMENDKIVPEKLKSMNKSKLSFASQIKNKHISKVKESESYLFTYLPTNVNDYKFPFLVNADFLTTANRQSIHSKNVWNLYIFEQIGYLCFKWIALLAQSDSTRLTCLNIIPLKFSVTEPIHEKFNLGFDKALIEIAFIPNEKADLSKVNESIVDFTELSELLGNDLFVQLISPNLNLVLNKLENKKVLKNIGVQCFEYQDIIELLSNSDFQNWLRQPENNFNFLKFLYNSKQNEIKKILHEHSVILDTNNNFSKLENIYEQLPKELDFLNLPIINPSILDLLTDSSIVLRFKEFTPNSIIIANKFKLIGENLTKYEHILFFWQFVYDNWNTINEDKECVSILNNCNILTHKIISKEIYYCNLISRSYFDDELLAILKDLNLNESVFNPLFISDAFYNDNRSKENWIKIFKECKAKSNILEVLNEIVFKLEHFDENVHLLLAFQFFKLGVDIITEKLNINQIAKIKSSLKVKCIDGKFREINSIVLGDYYTELGTIDSILPEIILGNQVSSDYMNLNNSKIWVDFFSKFLGIKIILEKQDVFDHKINYIINNLKENKDFDLHFKIIEVLSKFYFNNNDVENLKLDKLKSLQFLDNKNNFMSPSELHFCNVFNPALKLEGIDGVSILNQKYFYISKVDFLKYCNVNETFTYRFITYKYNECPDRVLAEKLFNSEQFKNRKSILLSTYLLESIKSRTQIGNVLIFKYLDLRIISRFYKEFVSFINQKSNVDVLLYKTYLKNANSIEVKTDNSLIEFLKNNACILNKKGEFKKPNTLYSSKLSDYITDNSVLVKDKFNIEIEQAIGINQSLNFNQCIEIFKNRGKVLTISELEELSVVKIISDSKQFLNENDNIYLMNSNEEWCPIDNLYLTNGNEIDSKNILHPIFEPIANSLGIKSITEKELQLNKISEELVKDIYYFFVAKAKFIAFQVNQDNYLKFAEEVIEEIHVFSFYETSQLWKSLPQTDFKLDIEFAKNENAVYFTNNWKTNDSLLNFLFSFTKLEPKLFNWFKNVIQWDENKIIQNLEDIFRETPFLKIEREVEGIQNDSITISNQKEVLIGKSKSFEDDVNNFIDNELEDSEWNNHIPELKSLLELGIENPKEKQKAYNLIAKLKLSQSTGIRFETSNKEFNKLEEGEIKYFVHSARGAFAYIHPDEIVKMKTSGYKMALDFGKGIVIYNSAEEILSKNKSHLMVYQNQENIDNVIQFCQNNSGANKHLLFIDPINSKETSKEIMNLLIASDEY